MKRERFSHAGETVKIKKEVPGFGGADFRVEDYYENVNGASWMDDIWVPAVRIYARRIGCQGFRVPIDNEVVYGKIGAFGYLFHVSELELKS